LSLTQEEPTIKAPNIVFIVADQFRGDSLGCAGHPNVKTPTYDRLAREGVRFSRAYTPNPICVPTRATLITGNYSHRCTGKKSNGGTVLENQTKLPELLAQAGYETYASGKLHYVPYRSPNEPRLTHGFQHWASAESGRVLKQYDPEGRERGVEDYFDYLSDVGWPGYSRAHAVGNNDVHPAVNPLPEAHNVDAWVASRAINFIESHVASKPDSPFFLHVGYPKPHSPFDPPLRYASAYDPRDMQAPARSRDGLPRSPSAVRSALEHGQNLVSPEAMQVIRAYYYGLISFQDDQTARILATLAEHGLDENTIVMFTADHGEMLGDFGMFFKSCMYEGSVHVPLIVRMPGPAPSGAEGAKPAGRTVEELVGLQDVMPTICELAGIEVPEGLDGKSLARYVAAPGAEVPETAGPLRDVLVSYSLDSPQQTAMVTDGRYKYVYNEMGAVEELYDVHDDPREEQNLIEEPDHREAANRLRERLIEWAKENGDEQLVERDRLRESAALDPETVGFNANRMGWRWY
jgi:arylsulfatase A-like enzyme